MITLRPYQQTIVQSVNEALSKAPKVLLQLPTGGGKTVIFCEIVKQYLAKNKKAIIVVHRKELLDQASAALSRLQIQHSLIAPGECVDPSHTVIVASVQSLNRKTLSFQPDILIIDEGHHAAGNNNWTKAIGRWPKAKTLGVTATPCRLDGKPLGNLFNILVSGPPTAELISQNYLAPVRVFSPQASVTAEGVGTRIGEYIQSQLVERFDTPEVAEEAVFNFKRICPDAKAIVFCCSVLHAEHTAQAFQNAGLSSACLHGKLSKLERESILQQFKEGIIQVITSRDLISEGTDIPDAQAAILLRPTQSESLYLQQVGRVLRTSPSKRFAVIIDLAGNTWKHGLPDEHREWSITRGLRKTRIVQITKCTYCDSILSKAQEFCDNCKTKNSNCKPNEQNKKNATPLLSQEEVAKLEIEELNLSEVTNRVNFIISREIRLNKTRWSGARLHWLLDEDRDQLTQAQIESFENMLSNYVFNSQEAWHYVGMTNKNMDGKPFNVLSAYKNRTELESESGISYSNWPMFIQVLGNKFMESVMENGKYEIYIGDYSRYVSIELQDLRFYDNNSKKLLTYYEIDPLIQAFMTYYVPLGELRYRLAKGECYWGR